jgi:hypothetical protein
MANVDALTTWMEKAKAAMRASPGKSSAVTGLALIMVVAWVRVLFGGHTSPATAQGATASQSPTAAQETFSLPHAVDQSGATLQQWAREPIQPLARNPFTVPLDCYPMDGSNGNDLATGGTGYWNQVSKSMSSRADQQEQRQILIDNIRLAAESLKLESTIMGSTPGAMINGQMVHEGSVVNGFRVLSIQARELIVEREGVKLAVTMN